MLSDLKNFFWIRSGLYCTSEVGSEAAAISLPFSSIARNRKIWEDSFTSWVILTVDDHFRGLGKWRRGVSEWARRRIYFLLKPTHFFLKYSSWLLTVDWKFACILAYCFCSRCNSSSFALSFLPPVGSPCLHHLAVAISSRTNVLATSSSSLPTAVSTDSFTAQINVCLLVVSVKKSAWLVTHLF